MMDDLTIDNKSRLSNTHLQEQGDESVRADECSLSYLTAVVGVLVTQVVLMLELQTLLMCVS